MRLSTLLRVSVKFCSTTTQQFSLGWDKGRKKPVHTCTATSISCNSWANLSHSSYLKVVRYRLTSLAANLENCNKRSFVEDVPPLDPAPPWPGCPDRPSSTRPRPCSPRTPRWPSTGRGAPPCRWDFARQSRWRHPRPLTPKHHLITNYCTKASLEYCCK